MKKILSAVLILLLIAGIFAGCDTASKSGKLSVVTTVFPEYDWTLNILGDKKADADVTLLLDNGVDIHSYQPTASDIIKISTCDVFVYIGGESDKWVDDALKEATNKDMIVINLMDVLGASVKKEEIKEGMQAEEEESEEEPENDEHIWLSPKNAVICCEAIRDALIKANPENKDVYSENAEKYSGKLNSLDKDFEDAVQNAKIKTLLFADRFPFRYLVDDYGLSYYAAFVGCSAESEASFETVAFLSKKVDELSLPAVFTLEGNDGKIAKTVISNAKSKDVEIFSLDSMQSSIKDGDTYIGIMQKNLNVLKDYFMMVSE